MLLKLNCIVFKYVKVVVDTLVRFSNKASGNYIYIVLKIAYLPLLLNNSTAILFNATSVRAQPLSSNDRLTRYNTFQNQARYLTGDWFYWTTFHNTLTKTAN